MNRLPRLAFLAAAAAFGLIGCETYTLDPPPQRDVARDIDDAAPDEIVVLVNSRDAETSLVRQARQRGYKVQRRENLGGLDMIMLAVKPPKGVSRTQAIRELERLEPRATAGVNHRYRLQSSLERYSLQASVSRLYTDGETGTPREFAGDLIRWPPSGCRAVAKIGIIDAPLSRATLASTRTTFIQQNFLPGDKEPDGPSHADMVAELMVGQGRVATETFYNAAVVSADSNSPGAGVFDLVRAIDWLQSKGVRVVNISLAGPYNKILDRAVQRAVSLDMIVVAAVGNDGPDAGPRYPAAFDDVIAVTAIDSLKQIYKSAVQGVHVDLAAPGVDVYVRGPKGGRYVTGTSIAAPFVTARIATDPAALRQGSAALLRKVITADAEDIGAPGPDAVFGAGLLVAPPNCRK